MVNGLGSVCSMSFIAGVPIGSGAEIVSVPDKYRFWEKVYSLCKGKWEMFDTNRDRRDLNLFKGWVFEPRAEG